MQIADQLVNVPDELKALDQWVYHKNKEPYNPKTGGRAKPNNPKTGASFEYAVEHFDEAKYDGLGLILANNGIVGVDLDKCIEPETGIVKPEALDIVQRLNSYTEVSLSGTGLHVFAYGDVPDTGRKSSKQGVEIYKSGRYLTFTGQSFGEPKAVEERDQELKAIFSKYFAPKSKTQNIADVEDSTDEFDDAVLLEAARRAKNGADFENLMNGDLLGYYKSASEADMALCNYLAYWTTRNTAQMDRIFRSSGLIRDKWDRSYSDGTTYGSQTINKAIADCEQGYGEKPKFKIEDLTVISAQDLQEKEIPPVQWVVEGLIPQGLTVIVAPPKYGKSWLMLDLCLSVVTGRPFLERGTSKCTALYLALEDGERRLKERQEKLLIFGAQAPKDLFFATNINGLNNGFSEQVQAFINKHSDVQLIIIDTLQKVRSNANARNVYAQDSEDLGIIKKVADQNNIAIVVVHHTNKGDMTDDPLRLVSGSYGISGIADTCLVLVRPNRRDTCSTLFVTGRDTEMQDLALEFNMDTCRWTYLGEAPEYVETQKEKDYRASPLVITLRALVDVGPWQGQAQALCSAIYETTKQSITNIEVGRAITKLEVDLYEKDRIRHETKRIDGAKIHKFWIEFEPEDDDVSDLL
ncbi:AAA family ATPase [Clostridia bacterium OttesenSCG-928-O13]|nr:AAA family ATPase [Clostridia bacterium OttesenSCG-928-O13]